MKIKMAHGINVFMCDKCAAVHIGLWRNGKMFAEAIPFDPKVFAQDLNEAIAESEALQSGQPTGSKH
ncbi:hypothetical protein [Aliihoeflea sp. PC F10.4]